MKFRNIALAALGAALFLAAPLAARAGSKPVMVYYMPWYVAKPHSDNWGWHWTMNRIDPNKKDDKGKRSIALQKPLNALPGRCRLGQ
jgi:hypothetical protein